MASGWIEGITVSIIDIRVIHWESVKWVVSGPLMCGVGMGAIWDSMVMRESSGLELLFLGIERALRVGRCGF